jgi:magnesium chelatase family protein
MSLVFGAKPRLLGLQAAAVTVEVHLANGLPSFTLVGLADVEVKEARERVRSRHSERGPGVSPQQAHHRQPGPGRSAQRFGPLRPAHCPGHSGRQRPDRRRHQLAGYEFAGELSLSGELRPVRGAWP